jgi:flagellar basal-body rod modification protein FlgD
MSVVSATEDLFQTLGLSRELEAQDQDDLVLEDFLNLMITELTHQDPFNPMDNQDLATQISQFATVSGIDELNNSFSGLSSSLLSDQALQAASLVGHSVTVPIDVAYLETGGSVSGVVGLENSASNLTIRITDSSGALVRELTLGTNEAGYVSFNWDGLTDGGEYAPAGQYNIQAEATADGETYSPYTMVNAKVESVIVGAPGQAMDLNLLGLGKISFDDVAEIH